MACCTAEILLGRFRLPLRWMVTFSKRKMVPRVSDVLPPRIKGERTEFSEGNRREGAVVCSGEGDDRVRRTILESL